MPATDLNTMPDHQPNTQQILAAGPKPRIAFATMVGDEPFFLPIWITYYARFVPKDQLFILVDGAHRILPPEADGCQILTLPHVIPGPGWDHARWAMISAFTTMLLGRFDVVVFNDVDEIIVADPDCGTGLIDLIARARDVGVISPFAIEVLHRTDLEPAALHNRAPILSQRRYGRINASYCKPCITARPVRYSLGGHYSDYPNLHLDPHLYLFHLRFADYTMLLARQSNRQGLMAAGGKGGDAVAGAGWSKGAAEMNDFLQSFVKAGPPIDTDFSFGWQRAKITKSWVHDPDGGIWRHDKLHNRKTYSIPPRFADIF